MPRKSRIISSTDTYHVILRTVNQQQLFEDEDDYQKCRLILLDCKIKYDVEIYAYCLMSNHIHILLKAPYNSLSVFFQSFGCRFVRRYNKKYQRFGHLFQERFISKPVEKDNYFLETLAYIHENPVKVQMCKYATGYRWSSCAAYYGAPDPLVDKDFPITIAGSQTNLQRFFNRDFPRLNYDDDYYLEIPEIDFGLGDDRAKEMFHKLTSFQSPADVQKLPKIERNKIIHLLFSNNFTYNQISRFCGVSKTTVYRICHSVIHK